MFTFVNSDIPAEIMMTGFTQKVANMTGEETDQKFNVSDLEMLKFLSSKKDLSPNFRLQFFDLFCKIFMSSNLFASGVMDNILDHANHLIELD
jgi:hypothetical protein